MKKKLRCLILLMLIVVHMSTLINVCAEVENTEPESGAYDFLKAIHVLDDGIIPKDLTHKVSRGEFALILSSALGYKNIEATQESSFDDVSTSSEFYSAISILKGIGIINGVGGDSFKPDENVVYSQAIKMIVVALGYDIVAKNNGDYPFGYTTVAGSIGLLNNISSDLNSSVTLGECSIIIKKALGTDVYKIDSIGNGSSQTYHIDKGDTLMKVKLGITKDSGRVTANDKTGLTKVSGAQKGYIEIDGLEYKASESAYGLLGYSVNFYYKKVDQGDDNEIVYIEAKQSNNVVNIKANDVDKFTDMTYSVLTEDKIKTTKYKLSRDIDVIVNGVAFPDYAIGDLTPLTGSITLIDSDGNEEYETVIIDSIQTYVVNNVTDDGIVYDLLGKSPLNLDDGSNIILNITKQGEKAVIKDFGKYSVLSTTKSLNTSGKININIKVIEKTVTGDVTEIVKDNADIDKIKIGDTLYDFSKELNVALKITSLKISEISMGMHVIAYLNELGEVAYYKSDNFETDRYGYVIKCAKDAGIENYIRLRLINDEGIWCTLKLADKVKLDGNPHQRGEKVENRELRPDDVIWGQLNNGSFERQLIRYRLNKDGNINMIDTKTVTPNIESTYDTLTFNEINPSNLLWTYKRGSRTFEGFFALSNKCVVFSVPGLGLEDDETQYAVGNAGYFIEGTNYEVHPYNLNETLISNVVIAKSTGVGADLPADITLALVDKVSKVSINGEETYKIVGLKDSKEFSAQVRDSQTLFIDRTDANKQKDCSLLNKGDVIRYQLDMQKKISNLERVVNSSLVKTNLVDAIWQKGGGYRDSYNMRGGLVFGMVDDIIALTKSVSTNLSTIDLTNVSTYCVTYSMQPPQIMSYDINTKRLSTATMNDLIPYTLVKDSQKTSFVYLHTINGDPKSAIIFKQ